MVTLRRRIENTQERELVNLHTRSAYIIQIIQVGRKRIHVSLTFLAIIMKYTLYLRYYFKVSRL